MVGGTTPWWDGLDMPILGPIFELQPHFRTPKMNLGAWLGLFVLLPSVAKMN